MPDLASSRSSASILGSYTESIFVTSYLMLVLPPESVEFMQVCRGLPVGSNIPPDTGIAAFPKENKRDPANT